MTEINGFEGKWIFESGDSMKAYLTEMKQGFLARNASALVNPAIIIKLRGNTWTISNISGKVTTSTKTFRMNEPFYTDQKKKDRLIEIGMENENKMVETQRGDPDSTIIRELNGDQLTVAYICHNVTVVRIFRRERKFVSPFDGEWKFVSGDPIVNYMALIGVKKAELSAAKVTNPRMIINVSDETGQWNLSVKRKILPREMKFSLDREFLYDRKTQSNDTYEQLCRVIFTLENDLKLVETQYGKPNVTIVREIVDEFYMNVTYIVNDEIASVRRYEKV